MKIASKKTHLSSCVASLCLLSALGTSAPLFSQNILIYGSAQAAHYSTQHSTGKTYNVQLGSFKNKNYAQDFKNKMAARTSERVYIVHKPDALVPYHVFVGPFNDVQTLNRVGQALLSETYSKPAAHVKKTPIKKVGSQQTYVQQEPAVMPSTDVAPDTTETNYFFDGASKVMTLSVGPAWSKPGKEQTFFLQPDIEKSYIPTNGTSVIGAGELFYGVERPLRSMMRGQFGLAIAGATNVGLRGNIWEDANPNFNNYDYDYNINHAHIALKGKLIKPFQSSFEPYLSASVGVGFNHAYDFTITPKLYEEVAPPLFQSNTTTAFTYTAGAGLQRRMNHLWIVGLGYEFADWGKSRLSAAPGQTSGNGLSLNHIYTNQLQLSLSYQPKEVVYDEK